MSNQAILASSLRWLARVAATALVLFVATFVFFEGFPNPLSQPLRVQIELYALLLMIGGMIAGWRWEFFGGSTILVGLLMMNVVELTGNNRFAGGAFPLFAIPGLLFLAYAFVSRRGQLTAA